MYFFLISIDYNFLPVFTSRRSKRERISNSKYFLNKHLSIMKNLLIKYLMIFSFLFSENFIFWALSVMRMLEDDFVWFCLEMSLWCYVYWVSLVIWFWWKRGFWVLEASMLSFRYSFCCQKLGFLILKK